MAKIQPTKNPIPQQPVQERIRNFEEVALGYSEATALAEAQRCLNCKKPACVAGCPVEVDIPAFIELIKKNDYLGAIKKIKEKNSLPAVCGRVCPQEEQCEKVCVLAKKFEPVGIGRLERFVADYEARVGAISVPPVAPPTGKKVAVVGSGPAGLTVAGDLAKLGHAVTIFEALHKPGGVLVYGIPEFRLPKAIVAREVDFIAQLGVKVENNAVMGRLHTVDELFALGYHAVFIGVGAGLPYFLGIPGENLLGVYSANEYLTRVNLMKAYQFPANDTPIVRGKQVAVVGGGNVAMDCSRTALRLGAAHVYNIYRRSREEIPARLEELENAEHETIDFRLLTNPVRIIGDDKGWVKQIECLKMELGTPDESGRRRPVPVKGSEFTIDVDVVVIAIGNGANPLLSSTTPDMQLNNRGYIVADPETGATTKPGVYAGGDIVTGAATVILAMGAGRKSARAMHEYLMKK
jgi:glutamate synthase (NADPH/NADH) small chain